MKINKVLCQIIHDIILNPPNYFAETISVPKSVMFEADNIEDFYKQLDKYLIENNVLTWELVSIKISKEQTITNF